MIQVDLPMPEACDVCPFNYDFCWCKAFKDDEFDQYSDDWNDHVCDRRCRPDYCPLKEQEPVTPVTIEWKHGFPHCTKCGQMLPEGDAVKYCLHCGQEVKWE